MAQSKNVVRRVGGVTLKWFKMYSEVLNDRKIQSLPSDLLRAWLNVLCIANENPRRGFLPAIEDVAFALRVPEDEAERLVEALTKRGLLDRDADGRFQPHNWDGRQVREEKSTDRVRRHRQKARAMKVQEPPADPPKQEVTGVEQNETCSTVPVTERLEQNGTALDKKRLEGEREEESLSNDNDSSREVVEVVVDGGTFRTVSREHRKTVEHARAVVGERFAAVVADQGSSLDASLGGRWDCYRAAIDAMKACGKRIDKPAVYCRQTALGFVVHGIPRVADVPIEGTAPAPTTLPLSPYQAKQAAQVAAMKAYKPKSVHGDTP